MRPLPIALRLAASFAAALSVVGAAALWWIHDQQELAYQHIAHLDPSEAEQLGDALRDHLLLGMFGLLVAGTLVAWFLVHAALRPVERLRRAAEAYEPSDAAPRLSYRGADDQIGRLARTFEDLLRRQHAHVERERRLLAEAGHELRTPVATMLLEIELALDGADDTALRPALRSIDEEARQLAATAEQLLASARGAVSVPTAPTTLLPVVRERARLAGQRFDLQDAIRVDGPPRLRGLCHAPSLARGLDNLLDNAIIHGEGPIRVDVSEVADTAIIDVVDHGGGEPVDFASMFAPFARGPDARPGTGTGLGLGLARSASRAMGGDVELSTDEQGRTHARITLRRAEDGR